MPKINVSISDALMSDVARLRKRLDLASDAEVIREGIRVLNYITRKVASGNTLLLKEKGSDYLNRLVFPKLEKFEDEDKD